MSEPLHHYQPGDTFYSVTSEATEIQVQQQTGEPQHYHPEHQTVLGWAECEVLKWEFEAQSRKTDVPTHMRLVIKVVPTLTQLRDMLERYPEMFANIPPVSMEHAEDMAAREQAGVGVPQVQGSHPTSFRDNLRYQQEYMAALDTPGSPEAVKALWIQQDAIPFA